MAHDQYTVLSRNDLPQRLGLYTGFHAGIFLHLLALAPIIGDTLRRLDHRLVAAAPQRQVDSVPGKFIILRIGQTIQTHANTHGHCHLVSDVDRLYLFQQVKPVLLKLGYRFFPQDHQILVLLHLLADAVQPGDILIHLPVDQGDEQGTPYLLHALQRLLIVVQIDHPHRQALVIHFLQRDMERCLVKEIHDDQITVIILGFKHIIMLHHIIQGNLLQPGLIIIALKL